MRLGVGVGWQQRAPHEFAAGEEKEALGISLDADFDNGFQIVLNWVDMGDSPEGFRYSFADFNNTVPEEFIGIGVGYAMDNWTFAANFGRITEEGPVHAAQEGYGFAVNYDLGGGSELQLGYSKSNCKLYDANTQTGGAVFAHADERCLYDDGAGSGTESNDDSAFSLGVAMSF